MAAGMCPYTEISRNFLFYDVIATGLYLKLVCIQVSVHVVDIVCAAILNDDVFILQCGILHVALSSWPVLTTSLMQTLRSK